jgi:hypothetical protein
LLLGCCPYELLEGTKSDLGPCPRYHAVPLKNDYEEARKKEDFGYDYELMLKLDELVRECDTRIKKHEQRIQIEEQEKLKNDPLEREIYELQQKAEKLGEEGNVDAYMEINKQIELLKQKKLTEQSQQVPSGIVGEIIQKIGPQSQQQKLRPCEVCASLLSINDKRLADHYAGKLHSGWNTIRNKLKELRALYAQGKLLVKTQSGEKPRSREREVEKDRDRDRSRGRDGHYDTERRERRDKDRDRERDRERDDNRKRSRDRDRDRDRRRDRERTERDRETDDKRRDNERERDRETKYKEKRESRI